MNPDEGTRIALHRALEARHACAMLLETEPDGIWRFRYIGKRQGALEKYLDYLKAQGGETTSTEIARELSTTLINAGNRLRDLYAFGLVRRSSEGIANENNRLAYRWSFFHPAFEYNAHLLDSAQALDYAWYAPEY